MYLIMLRTGGREAKVETVVKEKEVVEMMLDTVVVKEKVYIEKTEIVDAAEDVDSLLIVDVDTTLLLEDTAVVTSEEKEQEQVEEDIIISDRLVGKKQVAISVIQNDSTNVEDILELGTNAFAKDILMEFWESPLELIGYELNRSRLKLYGFNPYESYSLQVPESNNQLVLVHKGNVYYLTKTDRFKRLEVR